MEAKVNTIISMDGRSGRTIVTKTSLIGSSLIRTMVQYPSGRCEVYFRRKKPPMYGGFISIHSPFAKTALNK